MTHAEVMAKWTARLEECRRLGSLLNGTAVCEEILRDLAAIISTVSDEVLSINAAARESGYSAEHLRRLVRQGSIPNAGRPHAPKIRRAHLPRKRKILPTDVAGPMLAHPRRRLALAVVNSEPREDHDE